MLIHMLQKSTILGLDIFKELYINTCVNFDLN